MHPFYFFCISYFNFFEWHTLLYVSIFRDLLLNCVELPLAVPQILADPLIQACTKNRLNRFEFVEFSYS